MPTYLAVDPGETSGVVKATRSHSVLTFHRPLCTTFRGMDGLLDLALSSNDDTLATPQQLLTGVDHLIVEDYRVYAHKLAQHTGSRVYTAKVIGRLELLVALASRSVVPGSPSITIHYQMAAQAKQQWPDNRLRRHFGVYRYLSKHQRDALRHLALFLENNQGLRFLAEENIV